MKYIEIIADDGSSDTLRAIAEQEKARDFRLGSIDPQDMRMVRMLVHDDRVQRVLDKTQHILGAQPMARIVVLPVEVCLPAPADGDKEADYAVVASREAIGAEMRKNSRLDRTFLLLTVLSTIVAAVGLVEDNVAVIIGAMVIAPLLGPNLALSFATSLGDFKLARRAIKAMAVGVVIAVAISAVIGYYFPGDLSESGEYMARTQVGLDSVALALASGAAAALSLTAGVSSVLVGVMVAVALLPPAATIGISLGDQQWTWAMGAALMLAVNIVCLNLASMVMFVAKGVIPRRWLDKERAKRAKVRVIAAWALLLVILVILFSIHNKTLMV